jgi:hypothetical protein
LQILLLFQEVVWRLILISFSVDRESGRGVGVGSGMRSNEKVGGVVAVRLKYRKYITESLVKKEKEKKKNWKEKKRQKVRKIHLGICRVRHRE